MNSEENKNDEIKFDFKTTARKYPNTIARTIEIGNYKGGVGKSTCAVQISAALALSGHKVLLVDSDPQGNCSHFLNTYPEYTLTDLLSTTNKKEFEEVIVEARPNLHLIGANVNLVETENAFVTQSVIDDSVIKKLFKPIEKFYDFIIFDTKPFGGKMNNYIKFFVNEIWIPFELASVTITGLASYFNDINKIADIIYDRTDQDKLKIKYLIPTFESNTRDSAQSMDVLKYYVQEKMQGNGSTPRTKDVKILTSVPFRTDLRGLAGIGKTIFEHNLGGDSAAAFLQITGEILNDE